MEQIFDFVTRLAPAGLFIATVGLFIATFGLVIATCMLVWVTSQHAHHAEKMAMAADRLAKVLRLHALVTARAVPPYPDHGAIQALSAELTRILDESEPSRT